MSYKTLLVHLDDSARCATASTSPSNSRRAGTRI